MPVTVDSPLQATLFGAGEPRLDPGAGAERVELGAGAWLDRVPSWLDGDETLLDHLAATTSWHAGRRPMYDRWVDVPRLTAALPRDGPGHPVLDDIVDVLGSRYGEPIDRITMALYRDGSDSVAPHGDQVARDLDTSVMATVSCGAPRRFLLSPVAGGPSRALDLGHGDLLVMGGTVQRTWRHSIPKTNRVVGPRLCIMFRPAWPTRRVP